MRDRTGLWTIGTVSSGGTATLTLVATPTVAGQVNTTASVTTNNANDAAIANNSSSNTITVGASTDMAVTIVAAPGPYYQGQPVQYTITATNNGPNTATGVSVFDNTPVGIPYIPGSGVVSQGSISPTTGIWSVGTLLAGQSATLTLSAIPAVIGNITTKASIYQMNENDPVAANNISTTTIQVLPAANVEVTNAVASGPYFIGQNVVYTVTVENFGPRPATNLVVNELLPAGLTFVSASPSSGSFDDNNGNWTIGTLNTGVSQTLTLVATPTVSGALSLISKVTAQTEFDPVAANNADTTAITVGGSADLAITNTVSSGPYYTGQPVTYTVSVSNNGPGEATGVVISDLLPASLTYNSNNAPAGTSYNATTGEWTIATLTNGQTQTITITATPNITGTVLTTAEITATDVYDANLLNNSASNSITVGGAADLLVDVSVSAGPYNAGDVITFTLNVTNLGPNTSTDINVGGSLPAGFVLNNISVTTGVYDLANRIWTISSLGNSSVATMVLTGSLSDGGINTVSANIIDQGIYDPVISNNSDAVNILIDHEAVYAINSPVNESDAVNALVIATVSDGHNGPEELISIPGVECLPPLALAQFLLNHFVSVFAW
ncbi:MAG: DUF11 domain-containing protein [Sphingobacteriales bacterium]|nr:MAG: DUF11 domain-containing protein [Sphingobacteriales bacterium]